MPPSTYSSSTGSSSFSRPRSLSQRSHSRTSSRSRSLSLVGGRSSSHVSPFSPLPPPPPTPTPEQTCAHEHDHRHDHDYDCDYDCDYDRDDRQPPPQSQPRPRPPQPQPHPHRPRYADMEKPAPAPPVTWMSLPRKGQLAILFLCRFADFLQVAALQAFVFYQLKAMGGRDGHTTSDAAISTQAGLLQAAFTGAQVLTAMLWGKAADAPWCGRKRVLLIGLLGTAVSCVGYGFATTFFWAAAWRVFGGAVNGTVGIIRTMISEIIQDRKYQSRAFLILPMSFNLANMIGPVMGGLLADPATNLPGLFGPGSLFGYQWIRDYPYALPPLLNAASLAVSAFAVFFFLEETATARRGHADLGLALTARVRRLLGGHSPSTDGYAPVGAAYLPTTESSSSSSSASSDDSDDAVPMQALTLARTKTEMSSTTTTTASATRHGATTAARGRLPFWRIWTRNVVLTLVTLALYDFHLGAFGNVWALFLSTPRGDVDGGRGSLAHGLGMPAASVGIASSFLGLLGMLLQLTLYPSISARLGTLRSFRWFNAGFPIAYAAAPLLAAVPPASRAALWASIVLVLLAQVTARTFTLPASIILLNNCSPHPSVLGTVHGLGQSVSAGLRTVGPVVGGWWYGVGLERGAVQLGWWAVAAMAALGCVSALWVYEGSGHEIVLPGDDDDEC